MACARAALREGLSEIDGALKNCFDLCRNFIPTQVFDTDTRVLSRQRECEGVLCDVKRTLDVGFGVIAVGEPAIFFVGDELTRRCTVKR